MAGSSGTPLAKKLGVRAGSDVWVVGAPERFTAALEPLPEGASAGAELLEEGDVDVIIRFCRSRAELTGNLRGVARRLAPAGGL
jgi:hypothetical protein